MGLFNKTFGKPNIPNALMTNLIHLTTSASHIDYEKGGQEIQGQPIQTPFKGRIMPLSEKELQSIEGGVLNTDIQKLYTNGYTLGVNEKILDPSNNLVYVITKDLDHTNVHPMKRYHITRKGDVNDRPTNPN